MSNERVIRYVRAVKDNDEWDFLHIEEPIVPFNDKNLARLPSEQRQVLLKKQRDIYNSPFVHEFLGLEKNEEIDPVTVNLVSVILDFESREIQVSNKKKILETAGEDYERDKKVLKHGRLRRRIDDWSRKKKEYLQEIEGAETLRDDVLVFFVEDFFSDIDGLKLAVEEIKDAAPEKVGKLNKLLIAAVEILDKNGDKDRLNRFHYLEDVNSQSSTPDLDRLSRLLGEATRTYEPDSTNSYISQVSKGLVNFYCRNSERLFDKDRDIHLVRLTYDMLFAACTTRDLQVVVETARIVERQIKIPDYHRQLAAVFRGYIKDLRPFVDVNQVAKIAGAYKEFTKFLSTGEFDIDKMKKDLLQMELVQRPTRDEILGESLIMMNNLFKSFGGGSILFHDRDILDYEARVAQAGHPLLTYSFLGTLRDWLHTHDTLWSNASLFLSPESYKPFFDETTDELMRILYKRVGPEDQPVGHAAEVIESEILTHIFMKDDKRSVSDIARETENLRRQHERIRDDYEYFVALNGDRYIKKHDTVMNEWGVDSLTFYPIKGSRNVYKAVLRVDLPYTHRSENLTLFIGEDGRLYNQTGELPNIPVFIFNNIATLLYDRLEYITSGEAFPEHEVEVLRPGKEPPEREVIARRSHWRKLDGNRYTLQSVVAQKHIQQVLEDYGINTWEEILSRRSKGTLGQKQVLTYVKAVMREGAEPNIIVFKP